jgi:Outer membrane efflux protein
MTARGQTRALVVPQSISGRLRACMLPLAIGAVMACGCSRAYYRRSADTEVNCIVDNKSMAAGVPKGEFRIDVDPRSRMYDPTNPDCPPMPPDDPVSHQLMKCVDCKPGSPQWNHVGHTPFADNPNWQEYLPRDKDGQVVLDLAGAVQLAFLNSPAYQTQLETLYLSALDVTFERFRFDAQFFGGTLLNFTESGPDHPGTVNGRGAGKSSSLLTVAPSNPTDQLRVEKLTATGGELMVGFANSLMWQFAGPDNYSGHTLVDFSLMQPLLRLGGRTRVLERLTISERTLLANVRQMEQYRRGYYLNIVTGGQPGQGPQRRGGVFGGSGLEGFTGTGAGGFGQVGQIGLQNNLPQTGVTGGAGAAQAGGYLGLLQVAQVIRNQHSNIAGLGDSVEQLQAAYEAGRIDRFQVDLARQALYNAQSQMLNTINLYQDNLDSFKTSYGLPPNLNVKIADPLLDHFNLLSPELTAVQLRVTDSLTMLRQGKQTTAPISGQGVGPLPLLNELPPPRNQPNPELSAEELGKLVAQGRELKDISQQQFTVAQADFQNLLETLPKRRAGLEKLAVREDVRDADIDAELLNPKRLDEHAVALRTDLGELHQRLQIAWTALEKLSTDSSLQPADQEIQLTKTLSDLSGELLELSLIQARARLDAITFEPVDLSSEQAFCIASHYRRDWANARASLVDSWRLIHFNADDLQSDVDLVFSGDIQNKTDNPFRLRGTTGQLSVGLQLDGPLTRLAERNSYRQSLIDYQSARRAYYQFRDRTQRELRATLRQMDLDQLNFELRRAAVHVAITQVDLTRLRLSEPARPVAPSPPGTPVAPGGQSQFGPTTANDLVNALIGLLNVENDFLSVWVDNEVQRMNLDFQLGVMELDPSGLRIEHHQPLASFLEESPYPVPCELPDSCGDMQMGPQLKNSTAEPSTDSVIQFAPNGADQHREPLPLPGGVSEGAAPPTGMRRDGGVMQTVAILPMYESAGPSGKAIGSARAAAAPLRLPAIETSH